MEITSEPCSWELTAGLKSRCGGLEASSRETPCFCSLLGQGLAAESPGVEKAWLRIFVTTVTKL